eukprot:1157764-Pelagomonas_calceolata.AAC.14
MIRRLACCPENTKNTSDVPFQPQGLQLKNLTKPGHIFYFECQVPEVSDSDLSSDRSWVEAYPWTVVIIVVVGCLLLVMTSFALYLYKGKEVLRKLRNLKKRTQGLPSSGPSSRIKELPQCTSRIKGSCLRAPQGSKGPASVHLRDQGAAPVHLRS